MSEFAPKSAAEMLAVPDVTTYDVVVDFSGSAEFTIEATNVQEIEAAVTKFYTPSRCFNVPANVDNLELQIVRVRRR